MAKLDLTDKFILGRGDTTFSTTYEDFIESLEDDLDIDFDSDAYVKIEGDTMTGSLVVDSGADIILTGFDTVSPADYADRSENKVAFFDNTGKIIAAEPYMVTGNDIDYASVRNLKTVSQDGTDTATLLSDGSHTVPFYLEDPGNNKTTAADGRDATFDIEVVGGQVTSVKINNPGYGFVAGTVGTFLELNTTADAENSGPTVKIEEIVNDFSPSSVDVSIRLESDSEFVESSDVLLKGENGLEIKAVGNYITFTQASADVDLNIVERAEDAPLIDPATAPFWYNTKEGRMYVQYQNSIINPDGTSGIQMLWVDTNPNTLDGSEFINKTDGICSKIDATSSIKAAHFAIDHLPALP